MIRSNTRPSPWRVSWVRLGPCFVWARTNNQLTLSLESESSTADTQNLYENPLESIPWEQSLWWPRVLDPYKSWHWMTYEIPEHCPRLKMFHKRQTRSDDRCSQFLYNNSSQHSWLWFSWHSRNPFSLECLNHGNHNWHGTPLDWCQIYAVELRCLGPLVIGPIAVELRKRVFKWQFCRHQVIIVTIAQELSSGGKVATVRGQ